MLLGKTEVLEWLEMNDTPFWNIRRSEKGPVIQPSRKNENLTTGESKEYLERVLNLYQTGTYFIEAYAKDQSRNAWYKTSFQLGILPANMEGAAGIAGSGIGDIKEQVMTELKKEMELDRLRQENIELKAENDSWQHRMGDRIEPYIPHIIEGFFGVPEKQVGADQAQVAGIPGKGKTPADYQKRLEAAFDQWFKIEKQIHPVALIEKIVILAKTKPDQYRMAKKMLMNG